VAERYDIVTVSRAGQERTHEFVSNETLGPGSVIHLAGRDWLIADAEGTRLRAKHARYRLSLRHPDGRQEAGAFRRYRSDGPRLGHAFSTLEQGEPISWQVVDERLERDESGEPYLALQAERDYAEREGSLPDHELEHTLARRGEELPEGASAMLERAVAEGLHIELVALEPGETPDWEEAGRYIDAVGLEEINDDLLELCGVDPSRDPQETWLRKVKDRLSADLESFRAEIEVEHDEIEEWDFREGSIYVSVGTLDDEADPVSPHGWLTRLWDAGVLGAAGFTRVRKAELVR
jgi:hypothetical protein